MTAEDAADNARDLGNTWALPMLHAAASFPHSGRGDFAAAADHVAAAVEAIISTADTPNRLWTAIAQARLAQAQRDPDGVITALTPMWEMVQLDGVRGPGVQPWQPVLAEALTVSGAPDRATRILDVVEPVARDRRLTVVQVAIERERARDTGCKRSGGSADRPGGGRGLGRDHVGSPLRKSTLRCVAWPRASQGR